MRKIAILGKCSNSRSDAPMALADWEIWGLAWDPLPRAHRYFEMHQNWRNFLGNADDAARHKAWMAGLTVPVYMLQREEDIPASVAYPMETVKALTGATCHGTAYLESSIAYMMALASGAVISPPAANMPVSGPTWNISSAGRRLPGEHSLLPEIYATDE